MINVTRKKYRSSKLKKQLNGQKRFAEQFETMNNLRFFNEELLKTALNIVVGDYFSSRKKTKAWRNNKSLITK